MKITEQKHTLDHLHNEVPGNYYDTSIKRNLLQRFWHNRRFIEVKKFLEDIDASEILDVGCHGGRFTKEIASVFSKAHVYGIDVSEDAIKYAKKKYRGIKFEVAHAEKLPFEKGIFDLLTCLEVMEHIDNPKLALKEGARVLKKGGDFIILVPSENLLFKIIWAVWTRWGPGRIWNHTHVQEFRKTSLDNLLEKNGFMIMRRKNFLLSMLLLIHARRK